MAGNGTLYLFGGAYAEIGLAMRDFSEMQILHRDNSLGGYDAAIATRQSDGSVIVSNVDHTGWFLSITAGGVIGALIGVIVSPAPVVMAAAGAAGGAALGPLRMQLSRGDFKELGDLLRPGESGILLVADSITDSAAAKLMPRALRTVSAESQGGAAAIKDAVRQAAGG